MAAPAAKTRHRGANDLSQRFVHRVCEDTFPNAWFKGSELPWDQLFAPVDTETEEEEKAQRKRRSDNLGKILKALVLGGFLVKDTETKLFRLAEANPPPPDLQGAHTHPG
jgi:hypothetical protein